MKIGIPGYEVEGMFGVHSSYMDFASIVGTPVVLSPGYLPSSIEGFLLPGGSDVLPDRYKEHPGFFTGRASPHLEHFDKHFLPSILGKLPVFGICRGLQTINVALGGTLRQHLFRHSYSSFDDDLVHGVRANGSIKESFKVNSFHHQGVLSLGDGIKVEMYSSDKYEIPEAISGKGFFAVQWHPERMRDQYSINKFVTLFS